MTPGSAGSSATGLEVIEEFRRERQEVADQRERVWQHALENLVEGYDKAIAESIAGATYNWATLFADQLMPVIDKLDIQTQIVIMRYLFNHNRQIVRQPSFRGWMSCNAEDILDALPEGER